MANSTQLAREIKVVTQQKLIGIAIVAAAIFVILCAAGVVSRYSSVPYGDDWEGYVGFNLDVIQGKTSAWWALDDAHRLVLPRLVLWLDFHWFGARYIFVLFVNLIMRLAILAIVIALAREKIRGSALLLFSILTVTLSFSWMQGPNLYHAWAGLISFSTIICSLLAFYWLHRATQNPGWFLPAAFVGFVSIGTMANGLLVLPIMAVMSALVGLGVRRTLFLAILSAAAFALYLWTFTYPEEARPSLLAFTQFVLAYLGGPFYYVVYYWLAGLQHLSSFVFGHGAVAVAGNYLDYPGSRMAGIVVAMVAGGSAIATTAIIAWRSLWSGRTDTCRVAMLAFIGFVIASAAMIAVGRATFGFDYAFEERYTTGTMVAWQALTILLLASLSSERVSSTLKLLTIAVPIALLPNQLKAVLKPDIQDRMASERSLNALNTGQSDDPEIAYQVKRLKEMGIVLGK